MKLKTTKRKWKRNITCPICEQTVLGEWGDICHVCFWENDPFQYTDPTDPHGANHLCINDYKKRWNKLEEIMPNLIKKYNIENSELAHWKYDELVVPREHIPSFINELSDNGIAVSPSFYKICKQYGYNDYTFHGFPLIYKSTPREKNDEVINVIFTDNPIKTCEQYNLIQLLEILNKSENATDTWKALTPNICIEPNPKWKVED